ncbi:MAG TPA: hypothetical protein VF611_04390, partial [Pyrinomonadaceae bacterium]
MMHSSLGSQMLTAFERQRSLGAELMQRYSGADDDDALDEFLFVTRNHFLHGVHTAYLHATLKALTKKLGNQQSVAEALGLKHRTSISQMLRSETIDGVRLTAALDQFRDVIKLPPRWLSALYGFARATSFIKARALDDPAVEGTMSPEAFSFIVGMLASGDWDEAVSHPDPEVGRRVAAGIVRERAIEAPWPTPGRRQTRLRPEQYVLSLLRLR